MYKYFFIVALLFPFNSMADLLDKGFVAVYDVMYNNIELGIQTRRLYFTQPNQAIFSAKTIPQGFASLFIKETVTETSQLRLSKTTLQPIQYQYIKQGKKKTERYQLNFNWQNKKINNSYTQQRYPLTPNTHDLLSFQLMLMRDLQHQQQKITYYIASKKRVEPYQLKIIGYELLETPMGEFETIKLESTKTHKGDHFTLWCAKILEYLPVKIQKTEPDGDNFSFTIKSFSSSNNHTSVKSVTK